MAEQIPRVVIWGDGSGSTFRATVDAVHEENVNFDVMGVITTNPQAGILEHARFANEHYGMDIKPLIVEGSGGHIQTPEAQEAVLNFLNERGVKSLVLMGALTFMGDILVSELNGTVPEESLPKTLDEARALMVPSDDSFETYLPADFPKVDHDTGQYGLSNTHPAPTIVTAKKHGLGAVLRMVRLRAAESAHTYHVVGPDIDTGLIIAANRFPIKIASLEASEQELREIAKFNFKRTQLIEKRLLPFYVEMQLNRREKYLHGQIVQQ